MWEKRSALYFSNGVLRLAGDKELKPVSFRVREAAEGLLTVIMEHLVCHPGINGVHCPKDGDC